jgi:aspartyl-tRNA(Asn)/glutamyl-tRNA(Gln) amidotransferase subunit B
MSEKAQKYEMVVGLETHVELSTKTKIFCGCTTAFGGEPNTHCCPVCTGQPGALPLLNKQVVAYAVRAGLATHCTINEYTHMDRKNYVYPDLPKAYQISQFDEPLCKNGYVQLDSGKKIRILRIHIEEDAGKLVHENGTTYIDYNRGGVPLIEIVSEPDISSPEEAKEYMTKLQILMRYIGVSDCKMQEGSMRCDVNVSLRPWGQKAYGTRAEIKNMNSMNFVVKALQYEYERQSEILDCGEKVTQDTLRYDEGSGETVLMRRKEDAQDYRYFPEPDILPFHIPASYVEKVKATLPELPDEKRARYLASGISEQIAEDLYKYKKATDYLDRAVAFGADIQKAATFITGTVYSALPDEESKENFQIGITVEDFAALVKYVDGGKVDFTVARKTILKMMQEGGKLSDYIKAEDLEDLPDDVLEKYCAEAIAERPQAVTDFKNGRDSAVCSFYGLVKKKLQGKNINIKQIDAMLRSLLAKM